LAAQSRTDGGEGGLGESGGALGFGGLGSGGDGGEVGGQKWQQLSPATLPSVSTKCVLPPPM